MSGVGQKLHQYNRSLNEQQKVRGGALLIAVGSLLIGLLVFAPLVTPLQVLIAMMSVTLIVAGTLSLGTSGITGRAV
jgi:hypothetical protein